MVVGSGGGVGREYIYFCLDSSSVAELTQPDAWLGDELALYISDADVNGRCPPLWFTSVIPLCLQWLLRKAVL